VWEGLHRR
jgi:hypothetical protein